MTSNNNTPKQPKSARTTTRKSASPWAPAARSEWQTLPTTAVVVLLILRAHTGQQANRATGQQSVSLTIKTLACASTMCESTIKRTIKTLVAGGHLTAERATSGQCYLFTFAPS